MAKNRQGTPVWLITGCSTGFGREIALAALGEGARVIVTARRVEAVADICKQFPEQSLALTLDVTNTAQIESVVTDVISRFGAIDVLVNNAGYGYVGAIEEGDDGDVRTLFETNFFGAMALTKAVLPYMRRRRCGRIINNSSQAGLMANPGTGYYSASKYALEGLMEALSKEVAPFNIFVTSVEAGPFRTDWSGRSLQRTSTPIEDYHAHVGSRLDMIADMDGMQPGDPVRAANVFVLLANCEKPPLQLLLGAGVLASYREKLQGVVASLDEWEKITLSADFPSE